MRDPQLIEALNNCIDLLAAGATIEDCLRTYPQYAAELAPMLEAGRLTRRAILTPEESQARERIRKRFEREIQQPALSIRPPWRRFLSMAAGVVLVSALLLTAATVAAQDSLPGDFLYGLKLASESVRLSFAQDRANVEAEFNLRRIEEAQQLLTLGREAEVSFSGQVEGLIEGMLIVEGLSLKIDPQTTAPEALIPGSRVKIRARVSGAELIGVEIQPLTVPPPPIPAETPTPTASIEPSATETPSATASLRPSETSTATVTPSLTITPTPTQPTATLTAENTASAPTATPILDEAEIPEDCVPFQPEGWIRYQVQPGDTLSELVTRSGAVPRQVARANCIRNPRLIVVGQMIFLPRQPSTRPRTPLETPLFRTPQAQQNNTEPVRRTPIPTPEPTRRGNNTGGNNGG